MKTFEYKDSYRDSGPRSVLTGCVEEDGSEAGKAVVSLNIDVPEVFKSHFSFSITDAEKFIEDMKKLVNDAKWKEANRSVKVCEYQQSEEFF